MPLVERFVGAATGQRALVLLFVVALAITGVAALWNLPVEAFPDLTNNQVVVITEAPGLAAPEVEQRVSYPIETALMGVPDAEEVRSVSKFGLSLVTVVFDDRVPTYFARQLVTERLTDVRGRMPAGLEPTLGPPATAFGEIYQYVVTGDDPMANKTTHDWDVRNRLRSVPGVSEINSWGGLTKQFQVVVRPEALEEYDLSLREVFHAIGDNNQSFSGGFIEHRDERYTVRGVGLLTGVRDLERVVLRADGGVPVLLADVGEVEVSAMQRSGAVTRNGEGEVTSGMVVMLKGENALEVSDLVKARIDEILPGLPPGMGIEPFYDQSEVIDRTSATVRRNLIEGCLLVILVLFIFLRDVRAALIVAAVIPLSMLVGFMGMRVFGISANLMSLGAIDFGLIVDGAVVMMESFVRRRAAGGADEPTREGRIALIRAAAMEVARPVLFGVLIIIAVYLPILTLEGLEGKMFRPMAITVCSALFGSLLLSLTGVPVVSSFLLKFGGVHREASWFVRLRERYLSVLRVAMARKAATVGVATVIILTAVGSIPFLGTEFMPRLDEGSILIETRKLPSVSLEESVDISTRVEQKLLAEFAEISEIVTKMGRPDLATEAMGIYQGDAYVLLHPEDEWESGRSKEELIDALAASLSEIPGLSVNFTQPMAMRLDEVVSGIKADVAVKIFGPDAAVLERLGVEVLRVIEEVPGAADAQVEVLSGAAQLEVRIDRDALARYGLHVGDVQELVETAVAGRQATELLDGARRFPVVLRFPPESRTDAAALASLPIVGPGWRADSAGPGRGDRRHADGGSHQPRERRAPAGGAKQRAGARHRQLRFRGRAPDRGAGDAAVGVLPDLGRAVREPAAGDVPARTGSAAVHRDHLRAAVRHFPAGALGLADPDERPVRRGGRDRSALDPRPHAQPVGLGRPDRSLRDRRPERHRDVGGDPGAPGGRGARAPGRHRGWRRLAAETRPDDRHRRLDRLPADGALAGRRRRGAAPAGDGGDRGNRHLHPADAHRPADALRADGDLGGGPSPPAGFLILTVAGRVPPAASW